MCNLLYIEKKFDLPCTQPGTDPWPWPKMTGNNDGSIEINTGTMVRKECDFLLFASTSNRMIPSALSTLKYKPKDE